jgi:hypothetical protein
MGQLAVVWHTALAAACCHLHNRPICCGLQPNWGKTAAVSVDATRMARKAVHAESREGTAQSSRTHQNSV